MGDCLEQFCFILVMVFSIIFKLINHLLSCQCVSVKKIALAAYHLVIFFMHGILKKISLQFMRCQEKNSLQ